MNIEGKEYRLKQDIITPEETVPAGTVFDFSGGIGDSIDYEYSVIRSEVEDFDEWFDKVEVKGRWRAEKDGDYYMALPSGGTATMEDRYNRYDDSSWETGNYFKTSKEARDYLLYLKAKQRLKDSANGFTPNLTGLFHTISKGSDGLYIKLLSYTTGGIFFRSKEAAEESLEKHKDDWEFVINYETKRL